MQPEAKGAGLGAVLALVRELPRVSPLLTAGTVAGVLLAALVRPALAIAMGAAVGSLPGAVAQGWDSPVGARLVWAAVLTVTLFALSQILLPAHGAVTGALGRRTERDCRRRLILAASAPPLLTDLEDPAMQDDVSAAQAIGTQQATVSLAVVNLASMAMNWLGGLLSAAVVAAFSFPLAGLIVVAYMGLFAVMATSLGRSIDSLAAQTQDVRRASYYRDLAMTPVAAKESRVFALGDWLVGRFDAATRTALRQSRLARGNQVWPGVVVGLGLFLVDGLAVLVIGRAALRGDLTLGEMTTYVAAAAGAGGMLSLSSEYLQIATGAATVGALHRVEARARTTTAAMVRGRPLAGDAPPEVRFDDVTFSYPGQSHRVLEGLDLVVPAGRSLAIVGENGAGKTTLVKLLAGLYRPDGGRITVDGVDLADLDPAAWRARLTAIFQDFVRLELSARLNVGIGALPLVADTAALDRAAARGGADTIVASMPNGWETVLSRQYEGGVDPSGGQWQRIALSRALLAVDGGARLLVLDEPTANLDVRAEAELYDRFLDLTAGLTTVLISHRFSTVRRAHRIIVLEHGRVIEDGTHDELMAQHGRYAEMFALQAARFNDGPLEDERDGVSEGA